MEAPEIERSGEEEEGEEDFQDCREELVGKTRVSEEGEEAAGRAEEEEVTRTETKPGCAEEEEGAVSAGEDVELDEKTLLEMEKELTEEEKEERRKESTQLKEEGNELFKKGVVTVCCLDRLPMDTIINAETLYGLGLVRNPAMTSLLWSDYTEAEDVYSQALLKCPASYQKERAILYSNRAAARLKQDKTEPALTDCTKAIELNPDYIRALLRRAELYEKTDKLDEALADYQSVLEKDMSCRQAKEACMRLPRQIEERNERLKEEMISKLKDLGNLVLKPFGLSTDNFQLNQDNNTGSYSINFVQNRNNNR